MLRALDLTTAEIPKCFSLNNKKGMVAHEKEEAKERIKKKRREGIKGENMIMDPIIHMLSKSKPFVHQIDNSKRQHFRTTQVNLRWIDKHDRDISPPHYSTSGQSCTVSENNGTN